MVLVIVNLASLVFLVLFKPVPLVVQEMEFVYLLEIKWLVYVILDSQVMTVLKKLVQMIAQEMEIVLTEFVLVTMDGVVMIVDLVALEWVKIVMEMENVSPVHAIVILVGLVMVVKSKLVYMIVHNTDIATTVLAFVNKDSEEQIAPSLQNHNHVNVLFIVFELALNNVTMCMSPKVQDLRTSVTENVLNNVFPFAWLEKCQAIQMILYLSKKI